MPSKTSSMLGCNNRTVACKSRGVMTPLNQDLLRPQLELCVQFWVLHIKIDVNKLEQIHQRATKMARGLENMTCQEKLEDVRFSLEKKTEGGFGNSCQIPEGLLRRR